MSWIDFFYSCFFIPPPSLTEDGLPSQSGKVFIVTGGYAGVGKELCKILYQCHGTVYIAGRSKTKADTAISEIKAEHRTSDGRLEFLHLDLADLPTIKPAAEAFSKLETRLDVLVLNAGVMTPPLGSKTAQNHELQMGTNCLGHYLFAQLLIPLLQKTASNTPANSVRVCWASSLATFITPPGGMVWDGERDAPKVLGDSMEDYKQSKVGNIWLAREYQRRTGDQKDIVSLAFNPGNLYSELQRNESWRMWLVTRALAYPTKLGAYTELWAGWSDAAGLKENRNRYVGPWGRWMLVRKDIEDNDQQRRFWDWCEQEVKEYS